MRKEKITSIRRSGVEIRKAGRRWRAWRDPYHLMLTLPWAGFFALLAGLFLAGNLMFATAYWLAPGSVAHARPGSFADLFFFSIETFATVGYGEMYPASAAGHVISSIEIFIGLLTLALITGLMFARFSKPTARVLFSDKAVVRTFEGRRVLMVRIANERHNRMVEPTAHLGIVRLERTAEGESYYRVHDLALERQRNPVFALTWTLVHRIDESSPLYGWDWQALQNARASLTVSVFGHDETIAASVYALHEYEMDRVLFDHRFVDVISNTGDGGRIIDLTHFHDVVPCTVAG